MVVEGGVGGRCNKEQTEFLSSLRRAIEGTERCLFWTCWAKSVVPLWEWAEGGSLCMSSVASSCFYPTCPNVLTFCPSSFHPFAIFFLFSLSPYLAFSLLSFLSFVPHHFFLFLSLSFFTISFSFLRCSRIVLLPLSFSFPSHVPLLTLSPLSCSPVSLSLSVHLLPLLLLSHSDWSWSVCVCVCVCPRACALVCVSTPRGRRPVHTLRLRSVQ